MNQANRRRKDGKIAARNKLYYSHGNLMLNFDCMSALLIKWSVSALVEREKP